MKLDLIISDLRNSKEEYYEGEIIKHYSYNRTQINNNEKWIDSGIGYCSTGLLMKESGVNMKHWEGLSEILSMYEYEEYDKALDIIHEAINKLNDRYDIDFTKKYDKPIVCPCELILGERIMICEDQINTFEHLTFHLNDFHGTNFNEVADLIIEVSQKYNLETGEKI